MSLFSNRRGFTLPELMAVVAIIAILSALAVGSYRKSIERTRFTEAKTVAHQVAAARDAYYYDHIGLGTATIPLTFANLPLELKTASGAICSGSSCNVGNFTVYINASGYVRVVDRDGDVGLCVYQEAASTGFVRGERCLALSGRGQDQCLAFGYSEMFPTC